MIISVHTPKAGGMSFRALLEQHFGDSILLDYSDFPINTPPEIRNARAKKTRNKLLWLYNLGLKYKSIQCIHGHFIPYKYSRFYGKKNVQFVTWLRDPLERLASHYYFWCRNYKAKTTPGVLHRRIVEEKWSFEKFCFSPEMQNTYAQFLWKFPIANFDFVGITEHFDEDLAYFAKTFLGLHDVKIPTENRNPNKTDDYFTDAGFKNELMEFHAKDYEIYNRALAMRKARN